MNTVTEKLHIIQWIAGLNDRTVLTKIKKIKDTTKTKDWWDEISLSEKHSIERGIKNIKEGKTKSHSEVRKRYEKWIKD
jgi:hypothetical protein